MIAYLLPLAFQAATSLNTVLDTNPVLSGASYGVTVMRMDGTVVFNRDGNRRLIPASNQKILSTLYGVHPVSYTHLDVYKRQHREPFGS